MDRSDLLEIELATLFRVSQVLSRPCPLWETLDQVLRILHEYGELHRGVVSLVDPDSGALLVSAIHDQPKPPTGEPVRYLPGEGVLGMVLERGERLVLPRLADEPRFLDRLRLYDRELPLIGVPIRAGSGQYSGVLAAQPPRRDEWLPERARFLEMVANLIARSVRAAQAMERERGALTAERDSLRRTVRGQHGFDSMVGHSQPMQQVFEQVRQVAKWNTTVLVRGESGTGKELIACAIHYNSPRAGGPLLKLNCAALPDNLLESELFGHEKGAFTGAINQRKGRFEQAHGGTLFLDEVGELTASAQVKLLRVLQDQEFERVGGVQTLKVDVRLVAATNRDLARMVKDGTFRADLYYRLNVFPIRLPSLRERPTDIPLLAQHFLDKFAKKMGKTVRDLSPRSYEQLLGYPWPGNIRELQNVIERATILARGSLLEIGSALELRLDDQEATEVSEPELFGSLEAMERDYILKVLERTRWVIEGEQGAAAILDLNPSTLRSRMQKLNIRKPKAVA